ncbi:MAG: hypothetical protein MUW51_00645 [Lactococcus lactis]|nr:hypothetical protein [Lactococcus lactis]
MKKKMLLLMGLIIFSCVFSPLVLGTEGMLSTSSSSSGLLTPPISDNMDDFSSPDSPNKMMSEAEKQEARKDLDNYTSYMYVNDKGIITPSMNAGLQTFFVRSQFFVTKTIYRFVNFVNQGLNGNSVISTWRSALFDTAKSIYGKFMSPELIPVVAIGLISTLLYYFLHKRMMEGLRKVFLVIVMTTFFVYGGNNLVEKVHGAMSDVTTSVVKTISVAGVSSTDKNDLFTTMVKVPFLYLNFDDVKISNDGTSNIKQDDIDRLLTSGDDNDELKSIQEDLKDSHLTVKKLGDKFLTALGSVINALLLGAIYLFFSVFSFFMDFFFIILVFVLPFASIASFFPAFNKTILNWGKTSFGILILSGLGVFGTAFIGLFDGLVSMVLSGLLGSNYFFVTIVKMGFYIFAYKNRAKILRIFSAHHMGQGKFSGRLDNLLAGAKQKTVGALKAPVLAGVAGGMTAGMMAGSFLKDKITAGTGSVRHGWDNQRYNHTLEQLKKAEPDSQKAQILSKREEKLRGKMGNRQERFNNRVNKKENSLWTKYRQAYIKQRLGGEDSEFYRKFQEEQKKNPNKINRIKTMYDLTNKKAEEYLKNKVNQPEREKTKTEQLKDVEAMMQEKAVVSKDKKAEGGILKATASADKKITSSPIMKEVEKKPKVLHSNQTSKANFRTKKKKIEPWEKENENPFTQKVPDNPFLVD